MPSEAPPPDDPPACRPRLIVIGGGFSAASLVVQLLRGTRRPLDIVVVEPRARIGPGLAYSATDPDHRLNAPLDVHWIDPLRPLELRRWVEQQGIVHQDPACRTDNGHIFLRRADLGRYLGDQVASAVGEAPSGSTVHHVRDTATACLPAARGYIVHCARHGDIGGDAVVIATGNPVPAMRAPLGAESHPRIIANPLEPGCLDPVPAAARILVLGSGLTALDIASTFARRRHEGAILVVSRRGHRPRPQSPHLLNGTPGPVVLGTQVPPFMADVPPTIAAWTRALRRQIRRSSAAGQGWHAPFDALRDVVGQLWPRLPTREQLRFLQKLRVFYDVHRFRTPPMNEQLVAEAERRGQIRYAAARLLALQLQPDGVRVQLAGAEMPAGEWQAFDFVVNCTGLDPASGRGANPVLRSLLQQGMLQPHATGWGFGVGPDCAAIDARGRTQPTVRVIGPPSAGALGDPVAIPFIANQVHRMLPDLLRSLDSIHRTEECNP